MNIINADLIKNNIKSLRIRAGLTQGEVANLLGVTRQIYCIYENCPGQIKINTLILLSKIFKCSLKEFFYEFKRD